MSTYTIIRADDFLLICVPDGTPLTPALLKRFAELTDGEDDGDPIGRVRELAHDFRDADVLSGCVLTNECDDEADIVHDADDSDRLKDEHGVSWRFAIYPG